MKNKIGMFAIAGLAAAYVISGVANRYSGRNQIQVQRQSIEYAGKQLEFTLHKEPIVRHVGYYDALNQAFGSFSVTQQVNVLSISHIGMKTDVPVTIDVCFENNGARELYENVQPNMKLRSGDRYRLEAMIAANAIAADVRLPAETEFGLGNDTNPIIARISLNDTNAFRIYHTSKTSTTSTNQPVPLQYHNLTPSQIQEREESLRKLLEKMKEFDRQRNERKEGRNSQLII